LEFQKKNGEFEIEKDIGRKMTKEFTNSVIKMNS
jgi:hypothetical protein